VWTRDIPAQDIVPAGEAFIDLLGGRIDWGASTSPVLQNPAGVTQGTVDVCAIGS
jgi:hypothetical protein